MNIKPGVKLRGIRVEIAMAVLSAMDAYAQFGKEVTVTSVNDGVHGVGSLHFQGAAVDLRTRHLTEDEIETVVTEMRNGLGKEFDVVLESDHIHCEFQPKE